MITRAFSVSPPLSSSAFLTSDTPAPVFSRSSFICCAEIKTGNYEMNYELGSLIGSGGLALFFLGSRFLIHDPHAQSLFYRRSDTLRHISHGGQSVVIGGNRIINLACDGIGIAERHKRDLHPTTFADGRGIMRRINHDDRIRHARERPQTVKIFLEAFNLLVTHTPLFFGVLFKFAACFFALQSLQML